MAHKTSVDGTTYNIVGGKTLVNGTAYSIVGGKTLIDGTAYNVQFGSTTISFMIDSVGTFECTIGATWYSLSQTPECGVDIEIDDDGCVLVYGVYLTDSNGDVQHAHDAIKDLEIYYLDY